MVRYWVQIDGRKRCRRIARNQNKLYCKHQQDLWRDVGVVALICKKPQSTWKQLIEAVKAPGSYFSTLLSLLLESIDLFARNPVPSFEIFTYYASIIITLAPYAFCYAGIFDRGLKSGWIFENHPYEHVWSDKNFYDWWALTKSRAHL